MNDLDFIKLFRQSCNTVKSLNNFRGGESAQISSNCGNYTMKTAGITFVLLLILASCATVTDQIDTFIMDYPHGEYRIHVKKTGEAYLYYGAAPSAKIISKNTFSVDELYGIFRVHLHANVPREDWPNPESQAGMVTIKYADGKEENYLIFDIPEITGRIFDKAKENIEGEF